MDRIDRPVRSTGSFLSRGGAQREFLLVSSQSPDPVVLTQYDTASIPAVHCRWAACHALMPGRHFKPWLSVIKCCMLSLLQCPKTYSTFVASMPRGGSVQLSSRTHVSIRFHGRRSYSDASEVCARETASTPAAAIIQTRPCGQWYECEPSDARKNVHSSF